jgi:drug/metabolite transporter (DMT)-like permease
LPAQSLSLQLYEYVQAVFSLKTPKSEPNRQQHCKKLGAAENMAAKAAMAQGAPNYFTAEAMGFILAALFFNTLTAPVVKMTQNAEGGYDYNKWCIYFFAELMKLGVALAWCFKAYRENDREVVKHFNVDRSDFLQYAVPGFVFFAQNNLSFLALQHMNSSAFQLLMNTRIVSVAILAVVMLGKRMHALEWTSIVLLMVGAMQYQLSGCGDDGYKIDTMGLCVMAVIVACAAGGNVYTQKVMQRKMDQPLMVQNAMLYVWGVIFNGTNWILSAMPSSEHHGAPVELFGDVGGVQVFSMVFYAIYGLSISIILKRFGAITRTFINTAAICFTALIDVLFFGAEITPLELTTFGVIMLAVYLHTVLARNYAPPPPPPPATPEV